MSEHYVPILKGKQGELNALAELDMPLRDLLTPLVDIPRVPMEARHRPIEAHLTKTVEWIAEGWRPNRTIFVDLFDIDLAIRTTTGEHPVTHVFNALHDANIAAVPVIGLDRDRAYEDAVRDAASRVDGVVIRLLEEDLLPSTTTAAQILRMLRTLSVEPENAHLVLDLRSVRDRDVSHYVAVVARALHALPHIAHYASVTVSGSSVPQRLAEDVQPGTMGRIPRKELEIWRRLRLVPDLPRVPTFGDYGVVHPDNLDIDMRAINLAADIRYTSDRHIVVWKGQSFKSHPDGFGQYHSLAESVVALPEFRGPKFSWGDWRLERCATRRGGPGNKTTWVQVATSHHLAHVVAQLPAG